MKDEGVKKLLKRLKPLEDSQGLYRKFQQKRRKLIAVTLVAGVVSAVSIHLCSRMDEELAEGAFLPRREWDAGDYQITLQAKTQEQTYEFPLTIEARKLNDREKEELLRELQLLLPQLIRKDNQDLKEVTEDLYLPSSVQGYPFTIVWSSSNEERISRSGRVNRQGIAGERERVTLSATVSDETVKEVFTYEAELPQEVLDERERLLYRLKEKVKEADAESAFQGEIQLPGLVEGQEILWKKVHEDNSVWVILLALVGSICISRGMEYDLRQKVKKREQQLLLSYPDFVSRFRLYLSAGLTVKNAFFRIAGELRKKNCLQEEMQLACHQLENGMPEAEVYQAWGNRCGEMHYRRLSFLLSVHLKQGNGQLLTLLAQEAEHAQEERRNQARKAGEEAGTKLLAPMMLMLLVVMFLILLPAYLDFGGI